MAGLETQFSGLHLNPYEEVRIPIVSAHQLQVLAIIGQGYVGLPLAMAAVDAGWTVIGVDNLPAKVEQINGGLSPVEDVSNEQLKAAIAKQAYRATTDFSEVAKASVIAICVPTPLDENREPDLIFLRSAARAIAPHIANQTLVVSESTSYPGTLRDTIIPIVHQFKSESTRELFFACAPERVNPGDAIWNQKNTPRLLGAIDEESKVRALSFYESICDEVVSVSTPEVAEAAKLLENTFRLVNIALINEFTQLCSASGISAHEVIDAASSKPYGYMPFRPGVGVGGHCIPVDPLYLTWWARKKGSMAALVESADSINRSMPKYVAKQALSLVDVSIRMPRILLLGVAYKSGIGDTRETPMKILRDYLLSQGAEVAWYDPLVTSWEGSNSVNLDWPCDVAILATRQPEMDLTQLFAGGVKILDCTNTISSYIHTKLL
jgi:UDP-N-acetyl-D-glucosamine dehydrogenase